MKNLLIVLILFTFACGQKPASVSEKEEIDPKRLITCDGVGEIGIGLSYADLEKQVGADAITEHDNTVSGKFFTIWEDQEKQLDIYWNEESEPYKTIKYIEVNLPSYYLTPDSLHVGTLLREMVSKNGNMPLTFNNFTAERDPGLISSFNDGSVVKTNPCISGALEVIGQRNVHVADLKELSAKDKLESFDPIFERMDVALQSIRLHPKK